MLDHQSILLTSTRILFVFDFTLLRLLSRHLSKWFRYHTGFLIYLQCYAAHVKSFLDIIFDIYLVIVTPLESIKLINFLEVVINVFESKQTVTHNESNPIVYFLHNDVWVIQD